MFTFKILTALILQHDAFSSASGTEVIEVEETGVSYSDRSIGDNGSFAKTNNIGEAGRKCPKFTIDSKITRYLKENVSKYSAGKKAEHSFYAKVNGDIWLVNAEDLGAYGGAAKDEVTDIIPRTLSSEKFAMCSYEVKFSDRKRTDFHFDLYSNKYLKKANYNKDRGHARINQIEGQIKANEIEKKVKVLVGDILGSSDHLTSAEKEKLGEEILQKANRASKTWFPN